MNGDLDTYRIYRMGQEETLLFSPGWFLLIRSDSAILRSGWSLDLYKIFDLKRNGGPKCVTAAMFIPEVVAHGRVLSLTEHVAYVLVKSQPQGPLSFPDINTVPALPLTNPTS